MGRLLAKNKVTGDTTQGCVLKRRQAVGFGLPEVHDKGHRGGGQCFSADQAQTAGFDQTADCWGAFGDNDTCFVGKDCAVI